MDKEAVDRFWRLRSAEGGGRWTESELLDYEEAMLSPYVNTDCHILDLGSGPAVLSRRLLAGNVRLTAVDKYPDFLSSIPPSPKINTICSDILTFEYDGRYDLILLFGVVTHLEEAEELAIYEQMAQHLAPQGTVAVKNQVSRNAEKLVDGYSENLHCHYVGRYPDIPGQAQRLRQFFARVDIIPYPQEFNKWPDTQHVGFICSQEPGASMPG